MSHKDRTGEVWMDKMDEEAIFVVVGSFRVDSDGDAAHPVLMLQGAFGVNTGALTRWYEFHYEHIEPWEHDPHMKRIG